jgi:integrase
VSYIQYVNALHSKKTKEKYTEFLNAFLTYADIGCDEILQMEPKQLQSLLIQYIIDMRDKVKLAPNSMKVRLAAVKTFFQLNDFDGINWFKVKKYIGEFYRVAEDRPYKREEIKKLFDAAHSLRDKAIILLLSSSGIRRGGIIKLQLKHLNKIDKHRIYAIDVYKKAKEQYYTFCTPEARKAIEVYLDWRTKLGEKLTPESPLFRREFDTRFGARVNVAPMSEGALKDIFKRLREETGLVENQPLTESVKLGAYRSEIMSCHGFRKYFATTIKGNGMDKTYSEMVMGHDIGLDKVYFKPTIQEVLEGNDRMRGYISVINDLTINEENRLRKQVAEQEYTIQHKLAEKDKQIEDMTRKQEQFEQLLQSLVDSGQLKPTVKT